MGDLFSALFAKVAAVVKWFSDLFVAVFTAAYDLLRDVPAWCFDQVLSVAVSAVTALDTSALSNAAAGGWGSIPAEVSNILSLLGVGTAITIITAAIGVRLVLQLVPFTRLGS
ncbi:MAG TPA: DUF2523 family protein [Ramlibacter sp.]|uniref:DUF2523 family protein n=1 Tax=Ramlibacter sp. TaxID=1917967 RepID=UPI002D3D7206|nr:DUF2523 family protein [Ramlibacter sp.]HZY18630.1 DUF2523 family protein [Ramlibacter sp.]